MDAAEDYYEILQISPNAEPDTVHRVYRLLAQRLHPDNAQTGDETRFRALVEAYQVLGDPERRAAYDVVHTQLRQTRWRLIASQTHADNDMQAEQLMRLMVLELLYTRRRTEQDQPGLSLIELEELTGRAREHLDFTVWYLTQKKLVSRSDGAMLTITADGVEYLEMNFAETVQRRRLSTGAAATV